jgi:hypothetical protein
LARAGQVEGLDGSAGAGACTRLGRRPARFQRVQPRLDAPQPRQLFALLIQLARLLFQSTGVLAGLLVHLLQLVQEHRAQEVVLHRERLSFLVVDHEVREGLGHLLGDQAVLERHRAPVGELLLLAVMEDHRPQLEQPLGPLAHVGDVPLEAPR